MKDFLFTSGVILASLIVVPLFLAFIIALFAACLAVAVAPCAITIWGIIKFFQWVL